MIASLANGSCCPCGPYTSFLACHVGQEPRTMWNENNDGGKPRSLPVSAGGGDAL